MGVSTWGGWGGGEGHAPSNVPGKKITARPCSGLIRRSKLRKYVQPPEEGVFKYIRHVQTRCPPFMRCPFPTSVSVSKASK